MIALKTNGSVASGVRKWFARFQNGDNLNRFLCGREISKHQNMFKKLVEVDESFVGVIRKQSS
jgi:hypothetical protein